MKLRLLALNLHRYAGVMTGILLVIICLTGSLLIFEPELDRLLNPKLFYSALQSAKVHFVGAKHCGINLNLKPQPSSRNTSPLPNTEGRTSLGCKELYITPQSQHISKQKVVNIAQKAYPDLKPHRVSVPQKTNEIYAVRMVSPQEQYTDVFINPYNGKIVSSRPGKQNLYGFLINIHVSIFAGDIGKTVVGISGLSLLFLIVTGIIVWPGWRRVATGFHIRWKSPAILLNYDLHKVGGILSALFLILITFSGVMMVFPTQFESAVYSIMGTPPSLPDPTSKVVAGVPPMNVDRLLKKAEAALPGAKNFNFYTAKKPAAPFLVWMIFPQEKNEFNKHLYVYLDQYTGKVLRVDNPRKATLATRILNAQYILHIGSYGGLPMRILYAFIGFVVVILVITGLVLWRRRLWLIARRVEAIRHSQKVSAHTDDF